MITLRSNLKSVASIEPMLHSVFHTYNISQEHLPAILISVTEAVTNAIYHGNLLDASKNVYIKHSFEDGILHFNISDEGKGFDQNRITDPTKEENLEKCGGRGVFIMRELAHKLTYLDEGRELHLCFRIENAFEYQ